MWQSETQQRSFLRRSQNSHQAIEDEIPPPHLQKKSDCYIPQHGRRSYFSSCQRSLIGDI
jgi:hypothetical protein